jgi:amino acid transporter
MSLPRVISAFSLLMTSLSCMLGSGWLFGSFYTAKIAGSAALISWIIGGGLIALIALTFSELSTCLPLAGGLTRFADVTHGKTVSFCMSFLAWLSCVAVAPTEVQAILQYLAHQYPWLVHKVDGVTLLTQSGLVIAVLLLLAVCWINRWGAKLLTRFNSGITIWKITIPLLTAITLISSGHFHWGNFSQPQPFWSEGWHGVLAAIPGAVIFSFLGFSEATQLAAEAKKPQSAIPIAVLGSVGIGLVLYLVIQFSFIGAIEPNALLHGWGQMSFDHDNGPFAGIALTMGLGWLAQLIYMDAVISPTGAAIIYTTTTARMNYAASQTKILPNWFSRLNQHHVPSASIWFNFVIGLLLLAPFPSWQTLIQFQSMALVIAYGIAPICLVSLRNLAPTLHRPFRLPWPKLICLMTFMVCNMLVYWSGWSTVWRLIGCLALGFIVYLIATNKLTQRLACARFLIPHFISLGLLSYLGNYEGGLNLLPDGIDYLWLTLHSLIILQLAYRQRIDSKTCQHNLSQMALPNQNSDVSEAR